MSGVAAGAHASIDQLATSATVGPTGLGHNTQPTGSTFVVFVPWFSSTAPASSVVITDTVGGVPTGNVYTQVGATIDAPTVTGYRGALYICVNGVGGNDHRWLGTFGAAQELSSLWAVEGIPTVAPATVDQAPAGNPDSTSPYTSGTATTTTAAELLLAFTMTQTNSGTTEVITWGGGFTTLGDEIGNTAGVTGDSAKQVVAATGAYTASFTSAGAGTDGAVTFLITLKDASAPAGLISWGFSESPIPPRRRSPRIDSWSVSKALAPAALQQTVFSEQPRPRPVKRPPQENLPPLPGLSVVVSWGFSGGQTSPLERARVADWDPLPALAALPALAPCPEPQAPLPARLRRAAVADWEPLPGLPVSPVGAVAPEPQAPLPARLRRAAVADWEPLPGLPVSPVGAVAPEPQAPLPARLRRAVVADWEPLGPVMGPVVACQAPERARARRLPIDGWEPLAALPLPPLVPSNDTQPSKLRRAVVTDWEPLAALAPVLPPFAFSESPVPRKVRSPIVQAWEPLPAVKLPPVVPTGYECGSPLPVRSHRAQVPENWCPLGPIAVRPPETNQPYLLAAV